MVETAARPDARSRTRTRGPVIDCDIHEMQGRSGAASYLDERWKGYRPNFHPLPYNLVQGGTREDAWPHKHGYPPGVPGSVYELVRDQVLDPFDVEIGVLTGLFHPGIGRTDFEYHEALAAAYNDWCTAEWLSKDDRLHASVQVAFQRPEKAAEEIERCAQHARMIQVMLPAVAEPSYGQPEFRPIFEAAARHDLVIAMHQGSTTNSAIGYPPYYMEWHVGMNQSFMAQLQSMIFGGVFDDFPSLRVILLEGVFPWLPSVMWTMDRAYKDFGAEFGGRLQRKPSDYVREHVWFSSQPMPEPREPHHIDQIIEMVGHDDWLVFSTDYPHWDFDSPEEVIPRRWPDSLQRKVLYDNAKRLYTPRLTRAGSPLV